MKGFCLILMSLFLFSAMSFGIVEQGDDIYLGDLLVRGDLTAPFTVTRLLSAIVTGNVTVGGNVEADSVIVTGDLTVLADTNIVITGDLDIGGNADITGDLECDTLDVAGPATFADGAEITGALTVLVGVFTSAVSNILGPTVVTGMFEADSVEVNDYMLFEGLAEWRVGSSFDLSAIVTEADVDLGGETDTVVFVNLDGDTLSMRLINGVVREVTTL